MRVPIFEFDDWICEFDPRKGHLFSRGRERIAVRRGAFDGQLVVQRNFVRRILNLSSTTYGPKVYGSHDGGEQGGQGIVLYPQWERDTLAKLDGTMMRHDVGCFDSDGGPVIGKSYAPLRYALTARTLPNGYQRHDGPHYIRAYSHAVAAFRRLHDPVARMWPILCARDVMRRFPLASFVDGEGPEYSLAAMEHNVAETPHQGALGICRELAWCLRCVVEAQRVAPSMDFVIWISRFVAMLARGQSFGGALERHSFSDGLGQEIAEARAFGIQPHEEWCTSWQAPFLIVAINEARKLVPRCYDDARSIMLRIRPWWEDVPKVPGEDNAPPGLPRYLIVAEHGQPLDRITRGVGPARPYYDAAAFACFDEVGL